MQLNELSVLIGLAAFCTVLLLIILILTIRSKSVVRRMLYKQHTLLTEEIEQLHNTQYQLDAQQRDDNLRNLHQLNESLITTFSHMSRSQNDQVNAMSLSFDKRQQYMQQSNDESMRRMETRVQGLEESVARNLQQNEVRLEALRKSMDENLRLLREENAKKLNEMRATVDEKLNDTLEKRLSSSFSQVSQRLEQVYHSLGEVHSLASGVGDLKRMLSNVKTRGIWGEIQLGALLEQILTENQYQKNVAVNPRSAERVEFAICLPGKEQGAKPVYLPIDSKFPQEDYVRLIEASESADHEAQEAAQKSLLSSVKVEAKRIGKYIIPPHTTDFAVMFLPLESLYAEIARHSSVVEAIQREQHVLIAGPSTLLALLNSLQMGFRTLAIEQRSAEVWKLLGAVKSDFGTFAALLQKTQEKLQQATDSIDSAFIKTRTIEKRLRDVEILETEEVRNILDNQ